jgi:peptide deformylase
LVVPIILYGSSVLRKHSPEVTESDDIQIISDMLFDTLKKAEGLGLDAPQVNLLKRDFVIDTSPLTEQDKTIEQYGKLI